MPENIGIWGARLVDGECVCWCEEEGFVFIPCNDFDNDADYGFIFVECGSNDEE